MTDVLQLALEKRRKLHEQAADLNAFIRHGETLLRAAQIGETPQFSDQREIIRGRGAPDVAGAADLAPVERKRAIGG